jgi:hypothetical protein
MKRSESLLIGLLAISGASADSLEVRPPPPAAHVASIARQATRARLADLKNDVVRDVRATTTFMQEQANNPSSRSRWLTALAGCGLVMLQLRRKHKSMPQRRIAPYG